MPFFNTRWLVHHVFIFGSLFAYLQLDGQSASPGSDLQPLYAFFYNDQAGQDSAWIYLEENWEPAFHAPLLEIIRMSPDRGIRNKLFAMLEKRTGKEFGPDLGSWYQWLWENPPTYQASYFEFKANLYAHIDERFYGYFSGRSSQSAIRLDEVAWGGVKQDGIPPLRQPKMVDAGAAAYLGPRDVVFGIQVNGEAHAYPKRILAWHELFVNEIGGIEIAGVYCTLCGTVIAYETEHQGIPFDLGTSGFLYRSNKLMYDEVTQSLWSTVLGTPVIGPLTQMEIDLKSHSVVTTTWNAWREKHPDTKVLSLETGYERNYDEGEAYREYFATDQLMFDVPLKDDRLANKDEVLIVRAPGYQRDPLALAAKFLDRHPVYQDQIGDTGFVVITDQSGANRAYERRDVSFRKKLKAGVIEDTEGNTWTLTESALVSAAGKSLNRLPYHRIFWFAWYNTYPKTRLVY